MARVRTIAAAVLCAACAGGAMTTVSASPAAELDAVGKRMLDPIRERALAVPELIARLRLADDAIVADIGAGPGFLTLPLARAVPRGKVIATEIRADYLAVLEQRAREQQIANVITRTVLANDPGLERASIDLAVLCQVDHALADRADYFRTLKRALKPRGRIALINYQRYREADRDAVAQAALRVIDEWDLSGAFFAMIVEARR
jgi:SAM-dependent methyltransferase